MSDTQIYHKQPPALLPLYGKALLPKSGANRGEPSIPGLAACILGVSTGNSSLERYRSLCGFARGHRLPVTWPHILAFPLHLKLLTDPAFPLPLLGLVHLRNQITQHRAIGAGEMLDIAVRLDNQSNTDRGIEFDLITEARSAGALIWEEASTNLFRQPQGAGKPPGSKAPPPELARYPNTLNLTAAESIGRQYARVSGDRNPIHMHALSAKAFGFPKAIAHGMWTKAHALALLEQQAGWQTDAFRVSCQFKKPLFLPGTAQLNWQTGNDGWAYQVLNAQGDAPHLSGRIEWL
ncbi:MAG TPA: MaoC/PaaZ C-terminal domain-containing protein [Marinobacter sp.]|uniref:MaoC/PaaZ C-terminal domain-containing protein n=1 Tax=Marinobacter sp. TaxID=50741 RepID=UPI0026041172|nr:MaoC/PaaZ C-terminal domain-containing protein [Marinobacter sp.]HET8801263.1 MaoC/PaaZ C-terminal domain-containing protein [Marinobacter sp.]